MHVGHPFDRNQSIKLGFLVVKIKAMYVFMKVVMTVHRRLTP